MNEKPVPDYVGLLKALAGTKALVDATLLCTLCKQREALSWATRS
jgi:hypothetical protein